MQYYRLWIYSCNSVLGVTSAIFTVFAAFVLADVRLSLLGGVELYHPTFLYAYIALILQCGVVQTIGCLGAQRLSHKLLSIYWILLLLLTIGDVVVGLVWVYKLDRVKLTFRQTVLQDFKNKYSVDPSFTQAWNRIQSYELCCGVHGPQDFSHIVLRGSTKSPAASSSGPRHNNNNNDEDDILLPQSCCSLVNLVDRKKSVASTPATAAAGHEIIILPSFEELPTTSIGGVNVSHNKTHNKTLLFGVTAVPAFNTNTGRHKTRHYIHHRRRPPLHPTTSSNGTLDSMSSGLTKVNLPHFQPPPQSSEEDVTPTAGSITTTTTSSTSSHSSHWICPQASKDQKHFTLNITEHNGTLYSTEQEESRQHFHVHSHGCQIKLIQWLDWVSGLMFIMGFCIIGFIKVCFLVILRCEIKEMIEKIQNLEVEPPLSPTIRTPNLTLIKELRKESRANSTFAGITIKSPPEEDRDNSLRLNKYDRHASHSQETVNMTLFIATPRLNDTRIGNHRKLSWNEPFTSYFPEGDQQQRHEKFIRIPNNMSTTSAGSQRRGPPLSKPKDLSLASNHNRSLEQQRSIDFCQLSPATSFDIETDKVPVQPPQELTNTNDPYNVNGAYPRNGNNNLKTSNSFTLALIGTAV